MISFLLSIVVLIGGFIVFSRVTERCFGVDDRDTPAVRINDGVDCVPMKPWRAFLVQFLNIAGTGSIFGALMGGFGGLIAIVGVVACPITSGDTAFRSARLILAEIAGLNQKKIGSRLILTIPLLVVGALLTQLDFSALWRYFS